MKYYNQIAKGYNELYGEEQLKKIDLIKKQIKPKGLLLDIGAGTGISTKPFENQATCIALDPSIKMLKQYDGLKIVAKAESLPFKDNTFDTIISITALHHCNIKKALKEINRVAKNNAQIAITILKKSKIRLPFRCIEEKKDILYIDKVYKIKV